MQAVKALYVVRTASSNLGLELVEEEEEEVVVLVWLLLDVRWSVLEASI